MAEEHDLIVVGMGVGGEEVAGRAVSAGMDVLAVDKKLVGGECPYWGCIPSKMMLRAGNSLAEAARVMGLAGSSTVSPSWAPVAQRVRGATDNWNDKVAVERHEDKGTKVLHGAATRGQRHQGPAWRRPPRRGALSFCLGGSCSQKRSATAAAVSLRMPVMNGVSTEV